MNQPIDEKALIEAVLKGERVAFERLVRQYENLVLHIVTPIVGLGPDREDLCQDVFIKVYTNLRKFKFNSKLSTWIGTIAYNTSLNHVSKKRNVTSDLFSDDEIDYKDEGQNAEDILIRDESSKHIADAMAKLPPLQNTLLLLFHQDELSLEEICKITNLTLAAVKTNLFRARRKLKDILVSKP